MNLTKHEIASFATGPNCETGCAGQYRIGGLPAGEYALVSEFAEGTWRFLRWNEQWHGNWSGGYVSVDAAVAALREELQTTVA